MLKANVVHSDTEISVS